MTYKEITKKLGLRDPKNAKDWMSIYRREGKTGLQKSRRGRPKKDCDSLVAQIKRLEMENTLLIALAIELGEELPGGFDTGLFTDTGGNSAEQMRECLDVARFACYAWIKRIHQPDRDRDQRILGREPYERSRRTFGCRRIRIWIKRENGIQINLSI